MMDEIRLLDLVTLGRFNDGVPYIDMNVEGDLFSIFHRQIAGTTTTHDQEYASTFFHEYIHQIQAALFYPMQLLFLCRQWQIYEIYLDSEGFTPQGENPSLSRIRNRRQIVQRDFRRGWVSMTYPTLTYPTPEIERRPSPPGRGG